MPKYNDFRDLEVWKKCREIRRKIWKLCKGFPSEETYRLTEQMIRRQQEILTRLLEAEDAMREQELDKDRESKSAKTIERQIPPEFEEYLKLKEKEIELLRTVLPKLNPYYKREVMEYFNRLET